MKKLLGFVLLILSVPVAADMQLAQRNACMGCHAVSTKTIGPSYQEVARRYAGRSNAESMLAQSIRAGGAGKWGQIPMPAQTHLSDSDALRLAAWILGSSVGSAAPQMAVLSAVNSSPIPQQTGASVVTTRPISRIVGVQPENGSLKEVTFLRKSSREWEELHDGKVFAKFEERHHSSAVLRLFDSTRSATIEFWRESPKRDEFSAYYFAGDVNISSAKASGWLLEGRYFQVDSDVPERDSAWMRCAEEGGTCVIGSSIGVVRYGSGGSFFHRLISGQVSCHNIVFGDPSQGTVKTCDVVRLGASDPRTVTATHQVSAVRLTAHALVIGNANYPGSARLDNPINDATAISQRLEAMGFKVTSVLDANRQRLVQSLTTFKRTAANADVSILFYAGHGVQIFGTNYILPIDVDQSDPAQATIQGISLNSVVENFLPGKAKLVFLDACRDNPLMRSGDRSVSRGLAPMATTQGTLIAYATKDGQTAADGVGERHSPFTRALLEHLGDPADIGVVLRKVREKVMQKTNGRQQPWEYGSLTGGELILSSVKAGR